MALKKAFIQKSVKNPYRVYFCEPFSYFSFEQLGATILVALKRFYWQACSQARAIVRQKSKQIRNFYGACVLSRSETSLRRAVESLLNAQFLGQPCEIIEAPKLDQAPVKFFLISNSVNDVFVE